MKDHNDHAGMLKRLKESQEADHDNREAAREAALFVHKRDGQWEPYWWDRNDGKPRYTFDMVSPVIKQIKATITGSDYTIRVSPAGGAASADIADTFNGLVRNIEQISGAADVYSNACRSMVVKGLDGWRVANRYVDDDTFDQDLTIDPIANFIDRVWFGPHTRQDASDAECCWILTGLTPEEFKERYPDRSDSASVESDRTGNAYYYRQDQVMVGEYLYMKRVERELVRVSSGQVYEGEQFDTMSDELAQFGIQEVERRKRMVRKVCARKFDLDGWIEEPRETVFQNWIPVVPVYAHWDYFEDKVLYYGAVEKLVDPQRVFNYSMSREVEEGALAPRAKYWMTESQADGYEDTLRTLNTNSDPVQFYNPDERVPGPPQQQGGAQVNPGLRNISESMRQMIGFASGMFAANMGDNPGLQSGVAIDSLQDRGDSAHSEFIEAREVAMRHTGRILVNAIPRVYTPGRQVRILQEDGSYDIQTIGQKVVDQQTGMPVVLNDLTVGTYDVVCSSGPSFQNRQSETVSAIVEVGKIDPTVIEVGSDVLLGNINAPGMGDIAERKRRQLFMAGAIPPGQMTEEEQQEMQAMQQQPPQESPEMVLAKAEEAKAQVDMLEAQTKQAQIAADVQIKQGEVAIKQADLEIKKFEADTNRMRMQIEMLKAQSDAKSKGASAAKDLAEAEAQDLENDAIQSGLVSVLKQFEPAVGG